MQASGFSLLDTYEQVVHRAGRALGVDYKKKGACIVVNQGRVANVSTTDDNAWTLGGYLYESGGHMRKNKLRLGIYVPEDACSDVSFHLKVILILLL